MILEALTLFHVVISLIGLIAGFIVLFNFIVSKPKMWWTAVFLWVTLATSMTGFLFPMHRFLPSHAVGILSIVVLGLGFLAQYGFHLFGVWRRVFVIAATIALYFNSFVAIVQCFKHIPALDALAPTQSEPPFLITQLILLLLFIALGVTASRKIRNLATSAVG